MFTTYVAVCLTDILVDSPTGTRTSVTVLSDVTQTSAVKRLTTRELPLGCFKDTQYAALALMIRVREKTIQDSFEILICFSRIMVLFYECWWDN